VANNRHDVTLSRDGYSIFAPAIAPTLPDEIIRH